MGDYAAYSKEQKFDWALFLLCILPFGLDKLYKGSVRYFIFKFLLSLIGIGFIWWLFDIISVITGNYKVNPFS